MSVTIAGTPVTYTTKYLAAYAYLEIETGTYTSVVDNDLVITLNSMYDIQVSIQALFPLPFKASSSTVSTTRYCS